MSTNKATFGLDSDNAVMVFDSYKAATAAGFDGFRTAEDLDGLVGKGNARLIEIWNSITGNEPVTRFMNRQAGIKRIMKSLQSLVPAGVVIDGSTDETFPIDTYHVITDARLDNEGDGPLVGTVTVAKPVIEEIDPFDDGEMAGAPKPGPVKVTVRKEKKHKTLYATPTPTDLSPLAKKFVGKVLIPAPKPEPTTPATEGRAKVHGFPVTQAIAWMGRNGFKFAEATGVLRVLGVLDQSEPSTIRTYLTKGKAGTKKAADFNAAQVAELTKIAAALPKQVAA